METKLTSVILLNWEEFNVSIDSVKNLLKDREAGENIEIIFVDNGSRDFEQYESVLEDLLDIKDPFIDGSFGDLIIPYKENHGPSAGRNGGIDCSNGNRIFLLDGDILYVPGTIKIYNELFDMYEENLAVWGGKIGCIGYNDPERISRYGYNGTKEPQEAHTEMRLDYTPQFNTPIAWTQYGLFNGDLLRQIGFIEEGPFGGAGHGYEDDWLFHELEEKGAPSFSVNRPLYYHDANKGLRNLKELGIPDRGAERREMFFNRWGNYGFVHKLRMGSVPIINLPKPEHHKC